VDATAAEAVAAVLILTKILLAVEVIAAELSSLDNRSSDLTKN
jgi:hypothetical protein